MCPSSTSSSKERKPVVRDGLIPVFEGRLEGRWRQSAFTAITVVFLAVVVATGFIDEVFPVPPPSLVGKEAELDAERRREAKFSDGSLASLIEYDRRLRSAVRRAVLPAYARALYETFGFAKREVLVGKDGWMFKRERAERTKLPPAQATERAAYRLAALERQLASRGTRMVVLPLPRKSALYPEKMPLGVQIAPELEDLFEEALRRQDVSFVPVIDLYRDYQAKRATDGGDPLFFKVGTHWTPNTEIMTAEAAAHILGLWKPEEERLTKIVETDQIPEESDLFRMAGIGSDDAENMKWTGTDLVREFSITDLETEENESASPASKITLVGTSFSAKRQFPKFIEHFIGEPINNLAMRGTSPIVLINLLVRSNGHGDPATLFVELPLHFALYGGYLEEAEDTLFFLQSRPFTRFAFGNQLRLASDVASNSTLAIDRKTWIASLPAGLLAHDGGAILAVRLHGKSTDGAPVITVEMGEQSASVRWREKRSSVVVPLIAPAHVSSLLRISAEPGDGDDNAKLWIDNQRIEILGTFPRADGWDGVIGSDGNDPGTVTFDSIASLPPHSVLGLSLSNLPEASRLSLTAEIDGVWEELSEFTDLNGQSRVFASLKKVAGRELTRVRVRGISGANLNEVFIAPLVPSKD